MIYVYGSILITVAFFYLFVCVNEHGDGRLARTKIFFTVTVPEMTLNLTEKIFGKCCVRGIKRTAHYICNERNPIVQVMYFTCAGGGFYVYVTEGFQYIPNKYMSGWYHKYIGTVIMFMCYTSYFAACWVNPGKISKKSEKEVVQSAIKRYNYDDHMFVKKNNCTTCTVYKPARSKHCSMCGGCI